MPPRPLLESIVDLPDAGATDAFGARLAHAFVQAREARAMPSPPRPFGGLNIYLSGELGAGKTALVRAMLRALGHAGRVRSPTYTLLEPYSLPSVTGSLDVYHFDLYRFTDPSEWDAAGFREYFDSGALCLVEWPEQAAGALPAPDLTLTLHTRNDGRRLSAQAFSEIGKQCLERC